MDPTLASAAVADHADAAARQAAQSWSLPNPELLRRGGNAVYVSGDTIIRVSPSLTDSLAQRRINAWLADNDYPASPANESQALTIDNLDVSGWPRIDNTGHPDLTVVAHAAHRLHREDAAQVESVLGRPLAIMFPDDIAKTAARLSDPALAGIYDPVGLSSCTRPADTASLGYLGRPGCRPR